MSEPQSQQAAPSQQQTQTQQETPSEQDIQAEIEQTRERLGETVEELVAKADVKARAKDKAAELKAKAQVKAADAKTAAREKAAGVSRNDLVQRRWPVAAVAGAVVIAGLIIVWRRAASR